MIFLEPEKIKIYKVKPWAVYFKHNNEYFLLHYSSELYEQNTTLYKKHLDKNGNYNLEYLHSCYGNKIPNCVFQSKVYSHINKIHFVYALTLNGFIESKFSSYVENAMNRKRKLMDEIYDLQNKINQKRDLINKICPY